MWKAMKAVEDREAQLRELQGLQYEEQQRWLQEQYMRAQQNANPFSQGLMQSSPQQPQKPQEPDKDKRVLLCK